MSKTEKPEYKSIRSKKNIEIREYPCLIFAEVEVSGERREAIREGFKILADYIFGNNKKSTHSKDNNEKIPMTAPVLQQPYQRNWKVRFIMPKKYTLETLPKPNSKSISLHVQESKHYAVIRFSGHPQDETIKKNLDQLNAYLSHEKLKPIDDPIFAFYNPPWTLPFLRRNEVLIEIEP